MFASGAKDALVPIERAIVNAGSGRADLEDQLARLERMLPVLLRPGSRRGQVILGQDEAWDLMANTGVRLADAGFDVRIPRARAAPRDADAARVRRGVVDGGRRDAARRRAVVGGLRRRRADRGRHRPPGQGGPAADPLRWPVGRGRPGRPRRRGRRARGAGLDDAAVGRRHAPPRAGPRGLAARRRHLGRGRWLGRRPARRRSRPVGRRRPSRRRASSASCATTRPRRSPGSGSSTRPGSAGASRSTWAWARRRRCSPTSSPAPARVRRW